VGRDTPPAARPNQEADVADPQTYYFELPADQAPAFVSLAEEIHEDFGWLTKNRARSRGRDVFDVIDTVVVHATAGYATQHAVDTWRQVKASAHWIIPDEDEPQHGHFAWATVAEAKAAYHVGNVDYEPHLGPGTNVNNRSLGIEIVNTQNVQDFTDRFSAWQITMAAQIVLYAWAKYPNLKHVISHARLDPTRRADPGSNFPWEDFKTQVLTYEALPERNPLVDADYEPPAPDPSPENCCSP
jgi:N-acetyl-anhydromuramyl-L-alanine amidase AmpD